MAEIFLSYRRQDSQSATGRLADDLEAHFGDDRVFRDHEIVAGADFVEAIRRLVESATVLLVVVGPRWLSATDGAGRRRLDDRADFVRLEIELALAARVPIVPVLIEGAAMAGAGELPASLVEFARCQAVELSDKRWRYDVTTLIESLQARFAIDAAATPETRNATSGLAWARLATDLLDLALHPKRLIARRQTGQAGEVASAFSFLCAALLVGNLMLLTAIDIGLVARGSIVEVALGVATWLLTAVLMGLLLAGLLIGALALAWRLADRAAGYRRVGLVGAYVYGGTWLGLCAGAVLTTAAVGLVDPGWLARTVDGLHASMAASTPAPTPSMARLETAPMRGAASVLIVLGGLLWLATAIWCIAAWGAFRQAFAATRLQAWLATSVWLVLLAAIGWLPLRLA
jgi:hypothetical protein